ncbi:peptidoglycan glycosyltransferase FtsI [Vibrio sp. SS-MA-C1-2]|uniref:penicillin-binding transpeptidase domain-containing protein n=1 Tax=Vibrio sp. SS-MA-C1-2 TaxID=2908646 RepID=UPI001F1B7751|nr:penicillin-binding transpeptidase domain-containing protein [Vibrio sp. SS-MA-C1-2]UJF19604.1 peptidoglycan glycosyltransferase FtsI [Vibrio sp. SS-MA-C1-2]
MKKKSVANQRKPKPPSTFVSWRFKLAIVVIVAVLLALIGRVAFLQVIEPGKLLREGDMRSVRVKALESAREIIYDRNGEQLAVSVPVRAVIADPKVIFRDGGFNEIDRWYALADVLGLERQYLLKRLTDNKTRRFIYLQRQVSPAMAQYVQKLKLPGIGLKDESRRFYPTGEVSAHVIGMTGIDGHGLEGIERSYDEWLMGESGRRTVRKDRFNRVVENIAVEERKKGKSLTLSIDQRIQAAAYRAVKQAKADYQATSASAVLVDIHSGDVLAMVNAPSYNPNNRSNLQSFRMRNRAITDVMEPGSTVKPFVVLAALEDGSAKLDTVIDTGNGRLRIGGSQVRDSAKAGKASLTKILQKSSNVGVSKLSLGMPVNDLLGMYSSVGLSDYSGVNLIGETLGAFPIRNRWSDFERATLSFGYGLSVTPVQLARAYATLGAKGINRPLSILKHDEVPAGKRVIAEKTADEVLHMLEAVTHKGGSATKAAVSGYRVGAKTGTSRKAIAGGYGDEYVALTAGIAPISDPRFALVVVVNEPQGDKYYGGQVAAPLFSTIMQSALQLKNIAPDANNEKLEIIN